jgi:hypothetical protein
MGDQTSCCFLAMKFPLCIPSLSIPDGVRPPSAAADEPHTSKTPPTHVFAAWLTEHKPNVPLSHKQALDFVEEAPISAVNKEFLRDNLRAVPEVFQGQLNCPVELHTVFPRPDFMMIFEKLYIQGVHLCLAQGLRRFGKSVSILEAVLSVRAKVRELVGSFLFLDYSCQALLATFNLVM